MDNNEIILSIKNFTDYLNKIDTNINKIENFDFSLNVINELEKLQKKQEI
jgi:hypothetical protein